MSSGAPRINCRETYIPLRSMFSFSTSLAIALTVVSFSGGAAAVLCGTRDGSNTLQCNYDTPPISGSSPVCIYRDPDGALVFTNTGPTLTSLPGACPSITFVTKTSC
ncbi:hypothetical protein DFH09DRAFT_333035, partial [Mycena vulgaris]